MSVVAVLVTAVSLFGGSASLILLLNAALSFREQGRTFVSWIRLEFALLALIATFSAVNLILVGEKVLR